MRTAPFDWLDGERSIHFGRGRLDEAVELLGGPGYVLLATERSAAAAPEVADAAAAVHHVPGGLVDELAAELMETIGWDRRLVALGGGRVIDVGKALAAAAPTIALRRGRAAGPAAAPPVAAIPTTLSGAEMTRTHRHAGGIPMSAPRVRPAIVVNDPALTASQPVPELAASALNALGHAAEGPCTPQANPVATMAAREAARLLVGAFAAPEPDRDALALGALLAGYTIDSAGYGLHHVLSQTLARVGGVGHGPANAVMLPHSLRALAWRFAEQYAALAEAMGGDPAEVAAGLRALTGATSLRELGVEHERLAACADAAAARADLENTPPRADRAEILALFENAF